MLRSGARGFLALMVVLVLMGAAQPGVEARQGDLKVSVRYLDAQGAIRFSIENRSSGPVTLDRSSLPWLCPKRLLIVLEAYTQTEVMPALAHRDAARDVDCGSGKYVITKGGQEEGLLDLGIDPDALKEVVNSGGLLVFWYWRPRGDGLPNQNKGYGGVEIVGKDDSNSGDKRSSGLDSEVDLIEDSHEMALSLALFNGGGENASVPYKDLPWVGQGALMLRAGLVDPSRQLRSTRQFRHVRGGAWVTLPPGGFVTGAIPLNEQFADLSRVIEEQDVVIFWLLRLKTKEGGQFGPKGGFEVLRRRDAVTR